MDDNGYYSEGNTKEAADHGLTPYPATGRRKHNPRWDELGKAEGKYFYGRRKATKTKGEFSSDMALLKLVYLAMQRIEDKWMMPLANWSLTVQKLAIKFGDRLLLDINRNHEKD